jgi:hypothetical protein
MDISLMCTSSEEKAPVSRSARQCSALLVPMLLFQRRDGTGGTACELLEVSLIQPVAEIDGNGRNLKAGSGRQTVRTEALSMHG